jgi:ABC-type nitrate/sulfonate/bicarbonate transport system permease component
MPDRIRPVALGACGLLIVTAVVEALPRLSIVDGNYLPPFHTMAGALAGPLGRGDFWTAFGQTLRGWAFGLAISMALGVVTGVLIGSVPLLRALTASTVEFLRPIPSVALIPLVVLVYGSRMQSALVVYAAFWQVLVGGRRRPCRARHGPLVPLLPVGRRTHRRVADRDALRGDGFPVGRSRRADPGDHRRTSSASPSTAPRGPSSGAPCAGTRPCGVTRERCGGRVKRFVLPVALIALWWVMSARSTSFFWPPLSDIVAAFPRTWNLDRWRNDVLPSVARLALGYLVALPGPRPRRTGDTPPPDERPGRPDDPGRATGSSSDLNRAATRHL